MKKGQHLKTQQNLASCQLAVGQVGPLQPVDHPGQHRRLDCGEAVLREVDLLQADVLSQHLEHLLRLLVGDPTVDQACCLEVVDGRGHVNPGDSGQVSTSEEKMANRGGGEGKGGKEGEKVESCETAVGELQPGELVQR